jgi:hypothetical protein
MSVYFLERRLFLHHYVWAKLVGLRIIVFVRFHLKELRLQNVRGRLEGLWVRWLLHMVALSLNGFALAGFSIGSLVFLFRNAFIFMPRLGVLVVVQEIGHIDFSIGRCIWGQRWLAVGNGRRNRTHLSSSDNGDRIAYGEIERRRVHNARTGLRQDTEPLV